MTGTSTRNAPVRPGAGGLARGGVDPGKGTGMHQRRGLLAGAATLLAFALALAAAQADGQGTEARRELAPTGTLRVGLIFNNANIASRDPASGELRGVGVDLGRELAGRLGVPFEPVAHEDGGEAVAGLRAGQVDTAILAIDPARTGEFDFAPPHLLDDMTYAVRADSPIRTPADADRPGVRIAVPPGSVFALTLERELQSAELLPLSVMAAYAAIAEGTVDAVAFSRSSLQAGAAERPGLRVLEGRFGVNEFALTVPKGRPAALAFITEVIEQAKASGLVRQAAERSGLRGVQVPPPAAGQPAPAAQPGLSPAAPSMPAPAQVPRR